MFVTMTEIRKTIELLTEVFDFIGTSKVKAEIFRLAKFDKIEAVRPLWQLLHELLYFLEFGKIDKKALEEFGQKNGKQVACVKRKMQERGYFARRFSHLPGDMSGGSRDLLLAVAWLISKEKIVDKYFDLLISPLDTDFPSVDKISLARPWEGSDVSPAEKIQQLQLLSGRLRHSLKSLHSLLKEKSKLQHKVHEYTQGVCLAPDQNHLSVLEVYLHRHPAELEKMIPLLEEENKQLQCLIQWKSQEDIFWKWMETILDQSLSEENPPDHMVHLNILPNLVAGVVGSRRKLETDIAKYEAIIEQLEEMWEQQQGELSSAEYDAVLSAIDLEMTVLKENLAASVCSQQFRHYNEPRVMFVKQTNKKSCNIHVEPAISEAVGRDHVDIEQEITRLETHIKRLDLEAQKTERLHRAELDSLSTQMSNAICIQCLPRR